MWCWSKMGSEFFHGVSPCSEGLINSPKNYDPRFTICFFFFCLTLKSSENVFANVIFHVSVRIWAGQEGNMKNGIFFLGYFFFSFVFFATIFISGLANPRNGRQPLLRRILHSSSLCGRIKYCRRQTIAPSFSACFCTSHQSSCSFYHKFHVIVCCRVSNREIN